MKRPWEGIILHEFKALTNTNHASKWNKNIFTIWHSNDSESKPSFIIKN